MSVEVPNWRVSSPAYHSQVYFTVLDGISTEANVLYPGFMSGYDPRGFVPINEFNAVNAQAPNYEDYQSIPGTITGFSSSEAWHTPLHIIASDGAHYGIGCAVVGMNYDILGMTRYYFCQYVWNGSNAWVCSACFMSLSKTAVESPDVAYNKLPEYIYLSMISATATGSRYDPYPDYGGWYFTYFDDEDNEHIANSQDGYFHVYLIPQLYAVEHSSDINPDPEPTPIKNDDPYAPGGSSWTGGGDGKFDSTTDEVGIPSLPTLSATSTGFLTLFNPSAAQMRTLANYMWSGLFDIDTFRKIFADPMDCILGLSIVPVDVPSGSSAHVMVGNIDTGISMTTASSQYVEVDCGSISIEENYGAYLDYEPYTKAELYLPYIGTHAISIDDIMGRSVTIKYHVDILSGACVAYVKCGGTVLYSFIGQCSSSIPISGNDWTNVINGVLSIAGSVGSMVATGGATAPMEALNIASTAVNSMKPNIEKSGSLSGTSGLMGIQTPYLIITRPKQAIPANQNKFIGYPAFLTDYLGNLSGYTEVEQIHLEGISATGAELSEIETILKGGVIL